MSDTTVAPSLIPAAARGPGSRALAGPAPRDLASTPLRDRGRARLFGQFLLDHEAVTPVELSSALALMASLNETIGKLAVARGWLTPPQADHIGELQRTIDARWGDIAVALEAGGLSAEQVEQLLWEQTEDNLRIGDALVEVGALSCSAAEEWLAYYEASRAVSVVMADDPTGEYDPIRHAVDGLPRVLLRRAGLHSICSAPRVWRTPTQKPKKGSGPAATIEIGGNWSVTLGLVLSQRLGKALANRARETHGRKDKGCAVACDILEVLAFYVARRLDRPYSPPRQLCSVGDPSPGHLPSQGLSFTVATDCGDAVLVIDQR